MSTPTPSSPGRSEAAVVRIASLVCPAGGSLDSVRAAVDHGADEVYIGVKVEEVPNSRAPELGLRGQGWCYTLEQAGAALDYCRAHDVRLEVAFNNRYSDAQLEHALSAASRLYAIGVRDFIVADPGAIRAFLSEFPDAALHVSIMGGTSNQHTAAVYRDLGARRVILENNLTLDGIRRIREKAGIEVEVFVYGIPCFSYHGSCYLSSYQGSMWPPACARKVTIETPEGPRTNFFVKPRDLDLMGLLPRLCEAGVDAVKIEGRIRSPHYVATVTEAARHILDAVRDGRDTALPRKLDRKLSKLPFFGTSTGSVEKQRPEPDVFWLDGSGAKNRVADVVRNRATMRYLAGRIFSGKAGGRVEVEIPEAAVHEGWCRGGGPRLVVESSLCDPVIPSGADRICVGERQCTTRFLTHAGRLAQVLERVLSTGAEAWVTLPAQVPESMSAQVLEAVRDAGSLVSGVVSHDLGLGRALASELPVVQAALVQSPRAMKALCGMSGASGVRAPYLPLALWLGQEPPEVALEVPVFGHTQLMAGVFCPTRLWQDCHQCGPQLFQMDQGGTALLLFGNAVYAEKVFSAHLLRDGLVCGPFSSLVIDTLGQSPEVVQEVLRFYREGGEFPVPSDNLCNGMLLESRGDWHAARVPWQAWYPEVASTLSWGVAPGSQYEP